MIRPDQVYAAATQQEENNYHFRRFLKKTLLAHGALGRFRFSELISIS